MTDKKYKNLMVMLHGYGSNGNDLASLAPFFEQILPDTYFYSPNGIEACELGVYGYQWFSLYDRSEKAIAKELEKKSPIVIDMITKKAYELGIEEENIILLGFSQGTMVSLFIGLSSDKAYKAILGFSGRLFMPEKVVNKSTPICLIHGKMDDVVPYTSLAEAESELKKIGMKPKTLVVDNLTHSIDMQGIEFAGDFLKNI